MEKKPINVLLLTTSFPLSQGASSGIFILRMIRHLSPQIQVTVLTPAAQGIDTCMYNNENFRLHCFSYAPSRLQVLAHQPGGIPVALKQDKRLFFLLPFFVGAMIFNCFMLARKSDLIHANWSVNGVIAGLVGFVLRKPVITTFRGSDIERAQSNRLDRFLLKLCVKISDRLTTVSQSIQATLAEEFPGHKDKIVPIVNGVAQEFVDIKRNYEDHKPVIFTTAGSLIPRKAVHIILQALSLMDSRSEVRINILGDGPCIGSLQDLADDLGVHERVSFLGEISHDRMPGYLKASHVFILSSLLEGRPNVILEAMAAGLPVIASNIPGTNELISDGENGLLFESGSCDDLAAKMQSLVQSVDLRKRLGEAGRRYIVENELFMTVTAEQYQHLYETLCQAN